MGKLMKYDANRLWRIGRVFMIIIAGTALLSAILFGLAARMLSFSYEIAPQYVILSTTMIMGGIFLLLGGLAALVAFPIITYVNYYKSMFSDEGYLTHALPYKTEHLFYSKFFTGIIGTALLYIYAAICAFFAVILGILVAGGFGAEVPPAVDPSYPAMTVTPLQGVTVLLVILDVPVSFVMTFSVSYCIITFVSLCVRRARVIAGIGIYYGVSSVGSFLISIVAPLVTIGGLTNPGLMDLMTLLQIVFILVYHTALLLVSFFLARQLLRKKLNLE